MKNEIKNINELKAGDLFINLCNVYKTFRVVGNGSENCCCRETDKDGNVSQVCFPREHLVDAIARGALIRG